MARVLENSPRLHSANTCGAMQSLGCFVRNISHPCYGGPVTHCRQGSERRIQDKLGVFERQSRCCNGELRKAGSGSCSTCGEKVAGREGLDLASYFGGERRNIKRGYVINRRFSSNEAIPKLILPNAIRGKDTEAGDGYPTPFRRWVHRPATPSVLPGMRVPRSMRRTIRRLGSYGSKNRY